VGERLQQEEEEVAPREVPADELLVGSLDLGLPGSKTTKEAYDR
jgi:hypothetical protein